MISRDEPLSAQICVDFTPEEFRGWVVLCLRFVS